MDDVRNGTNGSAGLMDKLRNSAASQLGSQKDRATEGIGSVTQALRQSTQQLRDGQHETIAQYVDQAVGGVERFADRLKEKDVNELMRDAQQFARRNPALFVGTAFAVGIVAARFLKSSGSNGSSNAMGGWNTSGSGGYGGDWRERTGAGTSSSYRTAPMDYGTTGGDITASGSTTNIGTPGGPGTERF